MREKKYLYWSHRIEQTARRGDSEKREVQKGDRAPNIIRGLKRIQPRTQVVRLNVEKLAKTASGRVVRRKWKHRILQREDNGRQAEIPRDKKRTIRAAKPAGSW